MWPVYARETCRFIRVRAGRNTENRVNASIMTANAVGLRAASQRKNRQQNSPASDE